MLAEKSFPKVTHVIFDMDGTLVDAQEAHTKAATKLLGELGHEFSDKLKNFALGQSSTEVARAAIDMLKLTISENEFVARYEAEMDTLLADLSLMPGVERLLIHLHNERIPMAIATSSSQGGYKLKCRKHCNLFSVMHHVVCGNDSELKNNKPAPDIYLLAASRFARPVEPHCCLVFEDSLSGKLGALAAGMQVVMIPDKRLAPYITFGATQVLESMECFLPEQFGLPPYDCEEQFTFG